MSENEIVIERVFNAEIDLIWKTWTEPVYLKQWFGSDPLGIVENVDIELKHGGKYRIQFTDSDQSIHACKGEYLNIEYLKNLKMTWEWESEPDQISILNVDFIALIDKTKIILTHNNLIFNTIHNYEYGWNAALDKIKIKIIEAIK